MPRRSTHSSRPRTSRDGAAKPKSASPLGNPVVGAALAAAILIGVLVWWFWLRPNANDRPVVDEARTLEQIQRAKSRIDALIRAGNENQAAEEYRKLLEAYPDTANSVYLHGLLAGLLLKLDRTDEAVEVMEKLARRRPDSLDAGTKLAALYHDLRRTDDAIAELKRLTTAFEEDASAPAVLGSLYAIEKKDPAEGERYLRMARKRAPDDGAVAGRLAEVCEINGKTGEAIVLYREAIRGSAGRIRFRIELAKLLFTQFASEAAGSGEPYLREALSHLQAALRARQKQLGPRADEGDELLVRCYAQIAELHAQLKEYGPAIGHLEWAIKYSPAPNSFLWVNFARYALAAGEAEPLAKALAGIEKHWPNDPQMAFSLGMLYAEIGRNDEAIAQLRLAVKRKSDYGLARYQLAEMLMRGGDLAGATEHIFTALETEPRNPQYLQLKDMIVRIVREKAGLPAVPPTLSDDSETALDDLLKDILP